MLVLSRKKNESIVINDDITIVVVEIRGDKVRLGVEAPKEVLVNRREVYDAMKRNEEWEAQSATQKAEVSKPKAATQSESFLKKALQGITGKPKDKKGSA